MIVRAQSAQTSAPNGCTASSQTGHLRGKTAFELTKPEVPAAQAQEIVFQLGQMANDLDSYEAEAERLGLGK